MSKPSVIAMFDPIHPYAARFAEVAAQKDIATVCLWTARNPRGASFEFPFLWSSRIVGHHGVALTEPGLRRAAAMLRDRYDVLAVVPHHEPIVAEAVGLAELLGLPWSQPQTMSRFRDKRALKSHLSQVPDPPRTNRVALVSSVEDVREFMDVHGLDEVVLKPNDGFGNVAVRFFDRSASDEDLVAQFRDAGTELLAEERINGTEYYVNGQVYGDGRIDLTRVGRYVRVALNGKPNVEVGDVSVRTSDPVFTALSDYARHVMAASGVRSTPFHLECIVDQYGPCLVEVGARLVGGDARTDAALHGCDPVETALEHYLDPHSPAVLALDWARYDTHLVGEVMGYSDEVGRIAGIRGLAEAEKVPGFLRWSVRPEVGDRVKPTVDLFSVCWAAVVSVPDVESWHRSAEAIRAAVDLDVVDRTDRPGLRRAMARMPALGRLPLRALSLLRTRG